MTAPIEDRDPLRRSVGGWLSDGTCTGQIWPKRDQNPGEGRVLDVVFVLAAVEKLHARGQMFRLIPGVAVDAPCTGRCAKRQENDRRERDSHGEPRSDDINRGRCRRHGWVANLAVARGMSHEEHSASARGAVPVTLLTRRRGFAPGDRRWPVAATVRRTVPCEPGHAGPNAMGSEQ